MSIETVFKSLFWRACFECRHCIFDAQAYVYERLDSRRFAGLRSSSDEES